MRKQTKLVAVLSAAALLAMGASMTSFAAGWEKDDAGVWHYYDRDDEMVTGEWRKDGGKWFYLDEDGDMLYDSWVDDEYYVGSDGAMLINQWKKLIAADEVNDPDEDGEHWYYFGSKGKKFNDETKKIGGKTYYFDEDGKMQDGWYEKNGDVYYLGGEDEGWRAENQWLWLERPGLADDDHDTAASLLGCDDTTGDICDEEGWYWFGINGKMCRDINKKRVNGKIYYFNAHGQMLYEWINGAAMAPGRGTPSNAGLDGSATPSNANITSMLYSNPVEDGSRVDGWYEISGSEDTGTDNDTDWYFFKDGKVKRADYYDGTSKDTIGIREEDASHGVSRARIKVDSPKGGKDYFCFNELGQMQTGLQYIPYDHEFYYFDGNGYIQDGKVNNVECSDDTYEFYFTTSNGKNAAGYNGEKNGYLYFHGKKLVADDNYRLFYWNQKIYLVNSKGKIQKSKRPYEIENSGIAQDNVTVTFSGNAVKQIVYKDAAGITQTYTADQLLSKTLLDGGTSYPDNEGKYNDAWVSVPFIQLYDDNVYTYRFTGTSLTDGAESWYGVNSGATGWRGR